MTPEEIAQSKRNEPELWRQARAIRALMEFAQACGFTMIPLNPNGNVNINALINGDADSRGCTDSKDSPDSQTTREGAD